ncbi:uncharacterized protein FOMMEDRAFT_18758 [Fomitiporia mediterranea MF3/22]|uniref:uncharacterized protein n=1 Tax=Fomitiporia mediterranea (strain MF3/22) TaxID=694068 RepID=UPI00044094EA|nr:uncharacterized protein FOMMEDRAFT_18758 [Fomitiporia mediterranea MF3/22]EJD05108.1 hypothetical protein FOMMEDRAFT_18758 [Fomitiporia mediterranea MF3/22]
MYPLFPWLQQSSIMPRSPLAAIPVVITVYLALVRALRFHHVLALKWKYGDGPQATNVPGKKLGLGKEASLVNGRPDVKLSLEEAQEIVLRVTQLEMPGLMRIALSFALFKTYAIPTISAILLQSKQLSTAENVSKRYTDTAVLIATWSGCPIIDLSKTSLKPKDVDSRGAVAIARVNWLHGRWPNIKKEDFLYTLALFVLEPIRWAKLYGWRETLPIEQEAFFVVWKEFGRRMNIEDIPDTLQELYEWSKNYEETAMVPAKSNFEVGQYTLNFMLTNFTERFGVREFMRQMSICIMEERVRKAFMLPESTPLMHSVTRGLLSFFAIMHRYFSLPRFRRQQYIPRNVPAEKFKEKMPRFHPGIFEMVPWYKPEPTGLAWVWQNILLKIGILDEEYVPGPRYKSEGYRLEECGPIALEQAGHAEVMKMAAEIQGCPVTGIWAR